MEVRSKVKQHSTRNAAVLLTGKLSDLQITRVTFHVLNCPCNAGDFNEVLLFL